MAALGEKRMIIVERHSTMNSVIANPAEILRQPGSWRGAACFAHLLGQTLAVFAVVFLLTGCATHKVAELGRPGIYGTPVFAPAEPLLAVPVHDSRRVVVFDLRTRLETASFAPGAPFKAADVGPVVYTSDGRLIAAFLHKTEITVWDAGSSNLLTRIARPRGQPFRLALSPDGHRAVVVARNQTPELWDLQTGRIVARLAQGSNSVLVCAFSPEGGRLATADSARVVHLWDANSGERLGDLPAQKQPVASVALGPKGQRVLVSAREATVWSASGERLSRVPPKELNTGERGFAAFLFGLSLTGGPMAGEGLFSPIPAGQVAFASDGKYMAVVMPQGGVAGVANSMFSGMGSAQEAHIFEAATGKHLAVVAKDSFLHNPAFSPNGRLIAVSGTAVEVWDWQKQPVQKGSYSGYRSPDERSSLAPGQEH